MAFKPIKNYLSAVCCVCVCALLVNALERFNIISDSDSD